jgi:hypothetical protein
VAHPNPERLSNEKQPLEPLRQTNAKVPALDAEKQIQLNSSRKMSAGKVIKGILGAVLIVVGVVILIFAALLFTAGNTTRGSTIMVNPLTAVLTVFVAPFGLAFIGVGAKFV